jgi:hypothetical protein
MLDRSELSIESFFSPASLLFLLEYTNILSKNISYLLCVRSLFLNKNIYFRTLVQLFKKAITLLLFEYLTLQKKSLNDKRHNGNYKVSMSIIAKVIQASIVRTAENFIFYQVKIQVKNIMWIPVTPIW